MTDVDPAAVEAFIGQLSRTAGIPAPQVEWTDQRGSAAHGGRRPRIELSRSILTDPGDAYFTAAHEMGHVVLGHTSGRNTGGLAALYVGSGLLVLALTTTLATVVIGFDHAVGLSPTVATLVWVLLQRGMSRRLKQPSELAADLYAAHAGAPLTDRLAARYTAVRTRRDKTWAWIFPLHPSWDQRAHLTAAALGTPPPNIRTE